MPSLLAELRRKYHRKLCSNLLGITKNKTKKGEDREYFNNADGSNPYSVGLAKGMAERLGGPFCTKKLSPQASGTAFASITTEFLEESFALLQRFRPGDWTFSTAQGKKGITAYDQYRHLADLAELADKHPEIKMALGGDYLIIPDIIVGKKPLSDAVINENAPIIGEEKELATRTPFRAANEPHSSLHASISCKWTIRSDRAQNTRTEALNLLRNRKGKSPQMIVVTAEPLPSRLMSIALGTGDIDCTYHAALDELLDAARSDSARFSEHLDELETLVNGRRLRDISDLPFDLAI